MPKVAARSSGRKRFAQGIRPPDWAEVRTAQVPAWEHHDRLLARKAFPWARADDSVEDPTLDWFDAKGKPFAASTRRNPFGRGAPEDLIRVRWFVSRMDTPGYGGSIWRRSWDTYEKVQARNARRRKV